jgi:hypothetical protein
MIFKENKKHYGILIIFLAILFIFSIATNIDGVNGANKFVSTTGNDNNNGNTQTTPYKSISKAVTASSSSNNPEANEIIIAGGTYSGSTNSKIKIDKNICIYGAKYKGLDNTDTIITGGLNQIFEIAKGRTVHFYSIKFQNTKITGLGAAIFSYGGTCKLYNVSFTNCTTSGDGAGAVYGIGPNWSFNGVTFTNCNSTAGGAVCGNGPNWSFNDVTCNKCTSVMTT